MTFLAPKTRSTRPLIARVREMLFEALKESQPSGARERAANLREAATPAFRFETHYLNGDHTLFHSDRLTAHVAEWFDRYYRENFHLTPKAKPDDPYIVCHPVDPLHGQ